MKKILFIAALAAFTFTSCNDDDDDDNNSSSTDCFDCSVTFFGQTSTSEYCYTDGDDFYTQTAEGQDPVEMTIPEETNWDEISASLQLLCD